MTIGDRRRLPSESSTLIRVLWKTNLRVTALATVRLKAFIVPNKFRGLVGISQVVFLNFALKPLLAVIPSGLTLSTGAMKGATRRSASASRARP